MVAAVNRHRALFALVTITSLSPHCLAAIATRKYVDHSFNCPVSTLCPQVCAPTVEDCPTRCPNNETLCADGSCVPPAGGDITSNHCPPVVDNNGDSSSACSSPCAPVACAEVIDTVVSCYEKFAPFYDIVENCPMATAKNESRKLEEEDEDEEESSSAKQDLSWTSGINVFVYLWVLLGTVGIITWCWYKYVDIVCALVSLGDMLVFVQSSRLPKPRGI
jgi:hypothetical protein